MSNDVAISDIGEQTGKEFLDLFHTNLKKVLDETDEEHAAPVFQAYCAGYFVNLVNMLKKFGEFESLEEFIGYVKDVFVPSSLQNFYILYEIRKEKGQDYEPTHDDLYEAAAKFREKFYDEGND